MRRNDKGFATALAALVLLAGAAAQAQPYGRGENPPAEQRMVPYTGVLPACDDPAVLERIASEFAARESGFWLSWLAVSTYEAPSERGYRSNGPSYIPRRYCRGRAMFNDGVERRVQYSIDEDLGFIGFGYGVTWCVAGLDRNHAFSPACKAIGP